MNNKYDIIIVGCGASGMMAAVSAAQNGKRVAVFEKNDKPGRKLNICGKGRCNITNDSDIRDIIQNIPGNGKFLYSAFSVFGNREIIDFFNQNGVKTKVERGNRVFPESDKAGDIVGCFKQLMNKLKVDVMYRSPVKQLLIEGDTVGGIVTSDGKEYYAPAVIVATGGMSYPGTGSTGDGYKFARKAGHTVTELHPSLVPLKSRDIFIKDLQGLSLKNVQVTFYKDDKEVYSEFGEMLFTHFGVSGPVILSGSRHFNSGKNDKSYISIDLKPALDEKQIDARLLRDFSTEMNKEYKNALDKLLPQKMIPVFVKVSGIDENKKINSITSEERKKIIETLKHFTVTISGTCDISEAIITSGGVSINEINPKSMESKIIRGLYFAGEVIDIDGYTGGYNLTAAFSTGYCAGNM